MSRYDIAKKKPKKKTWAIEQRDYLRRQREWKVGEPIPKKDK